MTIGDFFDFDKVEYAHRISLYDVDRLRKQEVVKTRQHTAAICSITTGAVGALPSCGGTLLLSSYGARRLAVAYRKLALIQAELTKRGIDLHEVRKRDVLIPLGASIVGMGVGFGIDEVAAVATNAIPMEAGLPPGSSITHALSTNASDTISGAAQGVTEQTREIGQAILNIDNGIPAAQDLARDTIWAPAASTQGAIGFHAGMVTMQATEKGLASLASNMLATQTMEAMTGDVSKTKPRLLDTRKTTKNSSTTTLTRSQPTVRTSIEGKGPIQYRSEVKFRTIWDLIVIAGIISLVSFVLILFQY